MTSNSCADRKCRSKYWNTRIYGNWALIDLTCHELAHHRTSGHGKGFKVKYLRLRQHMVNAVISGKFYEVLKK